MRYAILLTGGYLAVDMSTQRPATYAHRSSANRAVKHLPMWMAMGCEVVRVVVDHVGDLPTYTVQ